MRCRCIQLYCLLAGLIWILAPVADPNAMLRAAPSELTISPDQQFAYADTLYQNEDFRTAEVEFKRFVHFFPEDSRMASASFKTGMALYFQEQFHEAARQFNDIILNDPDLTSPYTCEAYFMQSRAFIQMGNRGYARVVLENFLKLMDEPGTRDRIHLDLARLHIQATRRIGTDELSQALANLEKISPESHLAPEKTELISRIHTARSMPEKNPKLAGVLGIVPGGGFLYTGRIHDAAAAFILNTGWGLAAWKAFDQDNPALGSVITLVGSGFYIGGIYGAVTTAHKYNHAQKIQVLDREFSFDTGFNWNDKSIFFSFSRGF